MKYTGESGLPGAGGKVSTVIQQSLLPSINDPSLWRIKVKTGMEQQLVTSIMRKAIDSKLRGGPLRIKSAFCTGAQSYIYVEAIAEPLAREAIMNLRGVYQTSMTKVPVQEMTQVVTIQKIRKTPLRINQWARMTRGPMKGDLVKIVDVFEGGDRVMVQAVPRPDYIAANPNNPSKAAQTGSKMRPARRLFDLLEAKKSGLDCFRKFHPGDRHSSDKYDFWNNDYYKDGYLYKDVNPNTYLRTANITPTIEETKLFLTNKKGSSGSGSQSSSLTGKRDKAENLDEYENDEDDDEDKEVSVCACVLHVYLYGRDLID